MMLITCALPGNRPSWLARELNKWGLAWDLIVAVDAKMQKEGYSTREVMAHIPLTTFTNAYLEKIGVESAVAREMLMQIRLQSTWLGTELAKKGVNARHVALCEKIIMDDWNRVDEALFASLLPGDLTKIDGIDARYVRESLQELHREVNGMIMIRVSSEHAAITVSAPVVPPVPAAVSQSLETKSETPTTDGTPVVSESAPPAQLDEQTVAATPLSKDVVDKPAVRHGGSEAAVSVALTNSAGDDVMANTARDGEGSGGEGSGGSWEHL